MKSIAIITARGGSKRIPHKNIRDFLGKPIIAYSIEAAAESGIFDTVMVSTDDEEIANISKEYGAEVPFFRSEQNSGDFSTTADVLLEVISEYERHGKQYDLAICIYPTAPFVTSDRVRQGMDLLETAEADVVLPVVAYSYPPQRAYVERDGWLLFEHPENKRVRSQDLEKLYHDAGQFYCFRVKSLLKYGDLMSGSIAPLVCSELYVQDIDTESDWNLAELKYKLANNLF